jgi:hypothetical protein
MSRKYTDNAEILKKNGAKLKLAEQAKLFQQLTESEKKEFLDKLNEIKNNDIEGFVDLNFNETFKIYRSSNGGITLTSTSTSMTSEIFYRTNASSPSSPLLLVKNGLSCLKYSSIDYETILFGGEGELRV